PELGLILGSGAIALPYATDKDDPENAKNAAKKKGTSRLLKILISKSAHLIWTLRWE
ncbi:hypothetical protein BDR07DRAFT_1412806, partial [Suillus spraguei]